jgi:hypothetical protein
MLSALSAPAEAPGTGPVLPILTTAVGGRRPKPSAFSQRFSGSPRRFLEFITSGQLADPEGLLNAGTGMVVTMSRTSTKVSP